MTIEQLRYFLVAAETCNFSKAADKLYIHNTTICRGIANIENEFGAQLFNREYKTMTLTEFGQAFQREGLILDRQYEQFVEKMRSFVGNIAGNLLIMGPSAYMHLLDETCHLLKRSYPNIIYRFQDCNSGEFNAPYQAVLDGTVDIGVTYSTYIPEDESDLAIIPLAGERLDAMIPDNHDMFGQKSIRIDEMENTTFLISGFMGDDFNHSLESAISRDRGNNIRMVEMPDNNAVLMASAGLGVSFLPHALAKISEALDFMQTLSNRTSYAEIEDMDTSFEVVLVYKRDNANLALPIFLKLL